jgi:hypothetical protein
MQTDAGYRHLLRLCGRKSFLTLSLFRARIFPVPPGMVEAFEVFGYCDFCRELLFQHSDSPAWTLC